MSSEGSQSRFGFGSADPVTYEFCAVSESIASRTEVLDATGLCGSRSRLSERTRYGVNRIGGQLVLEPSPEDLAQFFQWILGGTPAGTSDPLAETIPERYLHIDRGAKTYLYTGCAVSRARFQSSAGGVLRLTLDIVARTETERNSGTFPALTLTPTAPFVHTDSAFTILSTARKVDNIDLLIDNVVNDGRFYNARNVASVPAQDRIVRVGLRTPFTSDEDDLIADTLSGSASTLVYTNGGYSLTFSFATLQLERETPTVPGRGEIQTPLSYVARKSGSTDELGVTLDSTP